MNNIQPVARQDLDKRLKRIEGQLRGVQKMLAEDRDCREIVQQLIAIRAAVQSANGMVIREYMRECLLDENSLDQAHREAIVDDLIQMIGRSG
ncbi:MAG: metal-sensitive transcriptional regulator [Chloroflexi bacterium]|nr:metal-sensitive transcriptional regulator [Chloroflexota bacterium]